MSTVKCLSKAHIDSAIKVYIGLSRVCINFYGVYIRFYKVVLNEGSIWLTKRLGLI